MRQQIDCAVLSMATHEPWMSTSLAVSSIALTKIKIHHLNWEDKKSSNLASEPRVGMDVMALAQGAVSLRRYDVCLIPVTLETLGWTRQALAAVPKGPFTPFVGILNGLRSAAMQDLQDLGMADFVRLPICPEELRARILTTVTRAPKVGGLREPEVKYGSLEWCEQAKLNMTASNKSVSRPSCKTIMNKPIQQALRPTRITVGANRVQVRSGVSFTEPEIKSACEDNPESFRTSKLKIIEQFERNYISRALTAHYGNIASAARASNKHRRAFWALMRKYGIEASQFRMHEDAE